MLKLFSKKQLGFVLSFLLALAVVGSMWVYQQSAVARPLDEPSAAINRTGKITADTVIEQIYFYQKCQEKETVTTKPSKRLQGMDYQAFQHQYEEWNIEVFNEGKVVMSLNVDDFCREHKANMFLGEKNGYVAVFYGKPDKKPILKELTEVSLGSLQAQAAEEIKQGLPFSTKAEMLYILEGMQAK